LEAGGSAQFQKLSRTESLKNTTKKNWRLIKQAKRCL